MEEKKRKGGNLKLPGSLPPADLRVEGRGKFEFHEIDAQDRGGQAYLLWKWESSFKRKNQRGLSGCRRGKKRTTSYCPKSAGENNKLCRAYNIKTRQKVRDSEPKKSK